MTWTGRRRSPKLPRALEDELSRLREENERLRGALNGLLVHLNEGEWAPKRTLDAANVALGAAAPLEATAQPDDREAWTIQVCDCGLPLGAGIVVDKLGSCPDCGRVLTGAEHNSRAVTVYAERETGDATSEATQPECACAMTEASMRGCPVHGEEAPEL